jgi:hypothetical protein
VRRREFITLLGATGGRTHGHLDLVGPISLVDMRGNSGGTTDANASAQQAASCAVAVEAFQVGESWRHGFTVAAVARLTR